ncbi:sulfotransferase [Nocardioides sp. JQ2195]|uniref:sulfotransferase family protein n=1 Tax=Nocardioides sp. JQ2195 TaxID=2592334 RepID=UPI00143E193D|nr:sulfotransferase [Nocardioides sp. JQ2195]QIX26514.1 sulfotransferase [Nocardioides sp. JQ2195]
MAEQIRIDDLHAPVLTEAQQGIMAFAEQNPVELRVEVVLDAASAATGLSDFGPDDFKERLAVWLEEIDGDPNRSAYTRMLTFMLSVKYASSRLRIQDLLSRHPEIHDIEITAPVVVTGLPRTGTTNLVNMLAADDRFRSMPLWEADEPVPVHGEGPGPDGVDPRFKRCQEAWETFQVTNPYLAAWHPMSPEHIDEDMSLMQLDFSSYYFESLVQMAPQWRDHYLSHDQTPHYEYLKTVLKVLTWFRGPQRWVLKCPQHLENLGPLMTTFPDATVVVTHRDPVGVVQSFATMLAYTSRMGYVKPDVGAIFEYWSELVERFLRSGIKDAHFVPEGQRVDVYFDRYMADPIGTVAEVYRTAGIEFSDQARDHIQDYIDSHPRDKGGSMSYDIRADFGTTPEELRKRFDFYLARYPVASEVK